MQTSFTLIFLGPNINGAMHEPTYIYIWGGAYHILFTNILSYTCSYVHIGTYINNI